MSYYLNCNTIYSICPPPNYLSGTIQRNILIMNDLLESHEWELNWHKTFPFHYYEQMKQEVYAEKMGLEIDYPDMDLKGKKILDLGAGPVSMLLKYRNHKESVVADPLMDKFPEWVRMRYKESGLTSLAIKGEELNLTEFDECWSYNVGQHTQEVEKYFRNLLKAAKIVRIFEWVETGTSEGHLHNLHEKDLNKWLGGIGKVEKINDGGAHGLCYYGVFLP